MASYVQRSKDKDGSQLFMENNASKKTSRAPSLKYSKEKFMNLEFYTQVTYFSKMKVQ